MCAGHWMLIAYEVRAITKSECPDWNTTQNVTGDLVVELDPYSNTIIKNFSSFDALDVCATYPGRGAWPSPEWIHMNSFDVHNVFKVHVFGGMLTPRHLQIELRFLESVC